MNLVNAVTAICKRTKEKTEVEMIRRASFRLRIPKPNIFLIDNFYCVKYLAMAEFKVDQVATCNFQKQIGDF